MDAFTSCSNCGCARVEEFCPRCGQEQGPIVPTVPQVVAEVGDSVFGYDSRIVRTFKGLLKPGFLTLEYLRGRRASYITPFRLYLLISAVYLFLTVTLSNIQRAVTAKPEAPPAAVAKTAAPAKAASVSLNTTSAHISVSANDDSGDENADAKKTADKDDARKDSADAKSDAKDDAKEAADAKSDAAMAEAEKALQKAEEQKKAAKENGEVKGGFQQWADRHETLATLLVLPLFAGLLYRAYRESHPLFLAHLVFAIHIQCVFYVLAIALDKGPSLLNDAVHALNIPVFGALTAIVAGVGVVAKFILLFFYLGKAIRAVYGAERGKARRTTIFLFLMLLFLTAIQSIFVWTVDKFVPGATYARFLPD